MNLSIIIVSYNTLDLTKRCLKSLTPKNEVIVADNHSTDGSVEMIRKEFSWVKLILNSQNLGFAKAVNQALRIAGGENFLLLNSDTIVKKGAVEKLVEFAEKVGPAIIGAKMLNPDGIPQASIFHLPTIKRAILEFWLGKKGEFSKYALTGLDPVRVEAVSGGAMLISREITKKIGLLDERYFMYFEDLDYCRRAKGAGFKIWYLPEAKIIHEHGASGHALADLSHQWRRLIPSSRIYHGLVKHLIISFILWSGQKRQKWKGN